MAENVVVKIEKNGGAIIAGTVAKVKEVDAKTTEVTFEAEETKNGSISIKRYVVTYVDGDKTFSTFIRNGKVEEGKVIMTLATPTDKEGYYKGYNFKYNGVYTLKGKPDAENKGDRYDSSVVLGTVIRATKSDKNGNEIAGGKLTKISIVYDSEDEEKRKQNQGDFFNCDAWSDPGKKGKEKFADNALNVLKPRDEDGKKKFTTAIIVTGQKQESTGANGQTYENYSVFSFTKVKESVQEAKEENPESASDDEFVKVDESVKGDIPFFINDDVPAEAPAEDAPKKLPWE